MIKSKFLKVGILSGLMLLALSGTSFAATWKQDENGAWRFVRNDGGYATESWAQSGSDWYYMNGDGLITTSSLIDGLNDRTYYVKADGVMARNEWIRFENEEVPAEPIWYYFGEDGSAYKGKQGARIKPRVINGKSYAFDAEGHMIRGFVTESGEHIENTGANLEFIEATYYFGDDGAMYQNQWLQYIDTGRTGAFSQLAQRNYSEFDELWLYFGEKGKKMVAPSLEKVKVVVINGVTYSFDENGVMIPRLFSTNSTIPATSSNAVIRYGDVDTSGDNKGDYWSFMVPNEEMSEEDYHMQEFSWFRTKADGRVLKNRIYTVLGRKYAFDGIGRMQTGFVIMYNDGTFGKQYDVDDWNSTDFLVRKEDSDILPLERGNLYLFGTDELNDGSMKSGVELEVILQDGRHVFGFKNNGVAYGNRFTLERFDNKFYFNGLRLSAGNDIGFAVIEDRRYGGSKLYVVDTLGRIVKGKNRVIQDGEGQFILIKDGLFYARVDSGEKPRYKNGQFWLYDSTLSGSNKFYATISRQGLTDQADNFVIDYNIPGI